MGAESIAAAAGEGFISSAFNAWQADLNRDFQRDMSNTAVQRQVKDMRAAGINPIMAVRYGGASTPAGSTAQATSARVAQTAIESDVARADIAAKMATAENQSSAAAVNRATERQMSGSYEVQLQTAWANLEQVKTATAKTAAERENIEKMQQRIEAEIKNIQAQTHTTALGFAKGEAERDYYRRYGTTAIAREKAGTVGALLDIGLGRNSEPEKSESKPPRKIKEESLSEWWKKGIFRSNKDSKTGRW